MVRIVVLLVGTFCCFAMLKLKDTAFLLCSYHKAQKRLRQMGRPEIDVSIERLKLRQNIEDEIKNFLWQRGFQRVSLSMNKKTEWNRELQLYERK